MDGSQGPRSREEHSRRGTGTHVLEDFELQGRGIQVVEFPCNGGARVRERAHRIPQGCAPPSGPAHPWAPPFQVRPRPSPPPRTCPSRVLTAKLQDLSILVCVRNPTLLVSRRPLWSILDRFRGRAGPALLQGLDPLQGHQGLGRAERSASHTPHIYRPFLEPFPLPAVPIAPTPHPRPKQLTPQRSTLLWTPTAPGAPLGP